MILQPRSCRNNYGLGSSPFARHYLGTHYYFLFLRVLRCFSSPSSPSLSEYPAFNWMGCPIRISRDHRLFAPTPGFSQLITSFFASESHRHPPCALSNFFLLRARKVYYFILSLIMSMNFFNSPEADSGMRPAMTQGPFPLTYLVLSNEYK